VWKQVPEEGVVLRTNFFFFFSHFWHVSSDDSLVITRLCTITKLRLLMIQSLTDIYSACLLMLTQQLIDRLLIVYPLQRPVSHTLNQRIPLRI
jgi:hypothetical protein